MTARIEMATQRFGRWTIGDYVGNQRWQATCDCGTVATVDGRSVRAGRSLGCIKCHPALGARRTHGQKRTRLYNIWSGMIRRCENRREPAYPNYGGRGIAVCEEWRSSFVAFRDWALAHGYESHLTIDREDNNKGYEPSNCRWATYAEQTRNYCRNRPIEYRGRTILVCDLAIEVGLPQDILKNRIFRYGWPIDEAVATPILARGQRRPFTVERRNIDA